MDVRPIRNEADYDWALAEIEKYFNEPPLDGSVEADRFDVLFTLVEAYEDREWRIDAPSPIDVVREFMSTSGRTQSDLARLLGSRARASEILSGKRRLTLDMIAKLHSGWRIPADLLIETPADTGRAA